MSLPSSFSSPLTLAFVADDNYATPLAVALYSALANLSVPSEVHVFILHGEMSEETRTKLQKLVARTRHTVSLYFVAVDEEAMLGEWSLQLRKEWTPTTFYRLLIDEMIPETFTRILYLDCDLVVEGDLLELWATDLQGKAIAAATERTVSCPKFGVARWREEGLAPNDLYFNAGLMLIDVERWRAENYGRKVLSYLHEYGDSLNIKGNQEGLNAVLAGDWIPLDPTWNVLNWYYDPAWFDSARYGPVPSRRDLPRIIHEAKVIHFTTSQKPWRKRCSHPKRRRYFSYLRRSGWLSQKQYWAWRLPLESKQLEYRIGQAIHSRLPDLGLRLQTQA